MAGGKIFVKCANLLLIKININVFKAILGLINFMVSTLFINFSSLKWISKKQSTRLPSGNNWSVGVSQLRLIIIRTSFINVDVWLSFEFTPPNKIAERGNSIIRQKKRILFVSRVDKYENGKQANNLVSFVIYEE